MAGRFNAARPLLTRPEPRNVVQGVAPPGCDLLLSRDRKKVVAAVPQREPFAVFFGVVGVCGFGASVFCPANLPLIFGMSHHLPFLGSMMHAYLTMRTKFSC